MNLKFHALGVAITFVSNARWDGNPAVFYRAKESARRRFAMTIVARTMESRTTFLNVDDLNCGIL